MADVSKNTHDPAKGYREVIFQQKRNLMDFDFNESQAILRDAIERVATQLAETGYLIGGGGAVTPDAAARSVKVAGGIAVHNGTIVRIPAVPSLKVFQDATVSGKVTSTVYVEYWDEEVTYQVDPDIHDPAFGESAARTKRNVEVKVNLAAGLPEPPAGRSVFELARVTHDFTNNGTTILPTDILQPAGPTPGEMAGLGPARTLKLRSAALAMETGFDLDTTVGHTSGDLLRVRNNGATLLSLRHDGRLDVTSLHSQGNVEVDGNIAMAAGRTVDGVDVSALNSSFNSHNHDGRYYTEAEIDGFLAQRYTKTETDNLIAGRAPLSHTHSWGQITGTPVYTQRWPTWSEVTSKPSSFTPSTHAASHASGGSDPISPSDIGAAPVSHNHDSRYYTQSASDGRFLQLSGGTLTGPLVLSGTGQRLVLNAATGSAEIAHRNGSTTTSLLRLASYRVTTLVEATFEGAVTMNSSLGVTGRSRLTGNRFDNRASPASASVSTSAFIQVNGVGNRALIHYFRVDPGSYDGLYDVMVYADNSTASEELARWTGQSGVMEDRVPWFFDSERTDDRLYVRIVKQTTGTADTFQVAVKAEQFA